MEPRRWLASIRSQLARPWRAAQRSLGEMAPIDIPETLAQVVGIRHLKWLEDVECPVAHRSVGAFVRCLHVAQSRQFQEYLDKWARRMAQGDPEAAELWRREQQNKLDLAEIEAQAMLRRLRSTF